MCNYQTLYHDDRTGYVVRCNHCDSIQVGYGNLMLTFCEEDFTAFRTWIHNYIGEGYITGDPALRNIVVPTPCEGVRLLLCRRELREFDSMLEAADSELQSLEMIRLFK
jgi:hypothetical protein